MVNFEVEDKTNFELCKDNILEFLSMHVGLKYCILFSFVCIVMVSLERATK
jgi:hypothetical protein